jgi:hypothetical protein
LLRGKHELGKCGKRRLEWTSTIFDSLFSNIIRNETLFDSNISRISVESIHLSPSSPGPRRRRRHRSKAVERYEEVSRACGSSSKSVVFSLVASSCLLFSDWIALQGGGSEDIAASSIEWLRSFASVKGGSTEARNLLLSAFLRLAFQLCCVHQNYSLATEIFIWYNDDDNASILKAFVKSIVSIRTQHENVASNLFECFMAASFHLLNVHQLVQSEDLPNSIETFWTYSQGAIRSLMEGILENQLASSELMLFASQLLLQEVQRPSLQLLYSAKCIWLIISKFADDKAYISRLIHESGLERSTPVNAEQRLLRTALTSVVVDS